MTQPTESPVAALPADAVNDAAPVAEVAEVDGAQLPESETPGIDQTAVEKVIDIMRPAIQADEGDIFLRGVNSETGVVSVELTGACVTCPVSTATLKDGIERILKARVDGVTSVEHVGAELAGASEGTAVSL